MRSAYLVIAVFPASKEQLQGAGEVVALTPGDSGAEDSPEQAQLELDNARWLGQAFVSLAHQHEEAIENVQNYFLPFGIRPEALEVLDIPEKDLRMDLLPDDAIRLKLGMVSKLDPLFVLDNCTPAEFAQLQKFCSLLFARDGDGL